MSDEINDVPAPGVDALQQREPVLWDPGAVRTVIEGNPRVLQAPNRAQAVVVTTVTSSDRPASVLGEEPARAVATLVSATDWNYHSKSSGQAAPIPAGVVLVLTHMNEIWVSTDEDSAVITCIAEYQAD